MDVDAAYASPSRTVQVFGRGSGEKWELVALTPRVSIAPATSLTETVYASEEDTPSVAGWTGATVVTPSVHPTPHTKAGEWKLRTVHPTTSPGQARQFATAARRASLETAVAIQHRLFDRHHSPGFGAPPSAPARLLLGAAAEPPLELALHDAARDEEQMLDASLTDADVLESWRTRVSGAV